MTSMVPIKIAQRVYGIIMKCLKYILKNAMLFFLITQTNCYLIDI